MQVHFLFFRSSYDNLGDYVCVAENNGGVMERQVTLTFDDPATLTNRGSGGSNPNLCHFLTQSELLEPASPQAAQLGVHICSSFTVRDAPP